MKPKTWTHPKFSLLKKRLGICPAMAAGILEGIWHLAATFDPDNGRLPYTDEEIAAWLGVDLDAGRLREALVDLRWIDDADDGLRVHDWEDHKPGYIRETERKRQYRDKIRQSQNRPEVSRDNHGTSRDNPIAADHSDSDSDCKEERPSSPAGDGPSRVRKGKPEYSAQFDEFWEVYPRSSGKFEASQAYAKAAKLVGHDTLMDAVRLFAPYGATLKDREGKSVCPHAATWLNQRRYEDDPAEWNGHAVGPRVATAKELAAWTA